jgi:hypothetical protein
MDKSQRTAPIHVSYVGIFQPGTLNPACGVDVSRRSSKSEVGSPKGVDPNRLTLAYLLADAKSFSEIFTDSVIGSYFRIVGKRFKLIHIGQSFFAKYVFIGFDA